jgi:hypothetical protein
MTVAMADATASSDNRPGMENSIMKLRIIGALSLAALSAAMPAAASAQSATPILVAMSGYAAERAGDDAATQIAAKKARYASHRHHKGKCKDCADCPDCNDCDEAARKVVTQEERAGICDPMAHAKKDKAGA